MSQTLQTAIAVVGIDIGKNSFHVVGLDQRGAIVLRQNWSRGQVEARFANMSPCLIGMEGMSSLVARPISGAGCATLQVFHTSEERIKTAMAVVGIDIGKNSFHVVGLDQRGAIVLRQKWSRGQVEARFANMPPCRNGDSKK